MSSDRGAWGRSAVQKQLGDAPSRSPAGRKAERLRYFTPANRTDWVPVRQLRALASRAPAFSCLLWKKFYIGFLHFRALSSVGQSGGLIIRWSQVQVLQGPLHSFLRQISILFSRLFCHRVFILALPQIVWIDFIMGRWYECPGM